MKELIIFYYTRNKLLKIEAIFKIILFKATSNKKNIWNKYGKSITMKTVK